MKIKIRICFLVFIQSFIFVIMPGCIFSQTKIMYLDVRTPGGRYYGALQYADSSGIFIKGNGEFIGISAKSIDVLNTGRKKKDTVEIKGIVERYYALLPLLNKYSKLEFKMEGWEYLDLGDYQYDGIIDSLRSLEIPSHVSLEFGSGPMSTPGNEQMTQAFKPYGGTVSFWGLTSTYPIDQSKGSSTYLRLGVYIQPRVNILFTYRGFGLQEIAGIGDFNFSLKSNNVGLIFNYLLSYPDYFMVNRWKVGIGAGPSLNNSTSEVILVGSGYYDPLFGLPISTRTSKINDTQVTLALNINLKIDYYFNRRLYLTSSLEKIFSSPITVNNRDLEIYTFDGAVIKTETFNVSFGIGVDLY